ncbi:DUF1542 domain-containing protein [Limosilactobacillus reuteri]|uniref:DUF1542 domain-containing protein n=1 Tax=Limosilactobacillus reuteri TaxID=1598 RepID=UPI0025520C8E|nr:DUF1542 domain-containing protein [Limosilactobacillus reuteri]MDL2057406.1 DUF1542 domain-containing protein [Limosilactobacillus reuteri]
MVSKNNKKLIAEKNRRNEKQRFAIRKLNVGVASVLLGITFSIYGGGQVVAHADTANASDQVATSDTGDNSLATKSEVALSSAASSANQSSISATSANSAVQSQASANSQTAVTVNTPASDNAVASNAAVEATKNQSTAENQPSASQKVQTPAQAQPVAQENSSSDASLNATRQVLDTIANRNSMPGANYLMSFAAVPAATSAVAASDATAEAEDSNAITVSNAQELMDALGSGTATTINIANNINMGDIKTGENINVDITNKRNITIQSSGATKNTVDFNGYSFKMNSNDYGVTFKNITLYGRSYFGIIRNAGSYTFDNVDYTGSQLVYTEAGYNSTVNFNGTVNANSVASYVGLNGTTYKTQGGGNQQVLQFRSGTNTINFNENSTVNLVTTNANVIENGGGTTNINVKKGANVILEPHTQTGMEQFFSVNGIARGIASNATTNLTIDEGANLNISLKDNPDDAYHSSALYLNSGATIKNNGNLTITSDGTPYYKSSGIDAPVYINGTAVINVGNTGNLTLTATNLGTYNGDLMKINGTGTVSLDPHSTFKINADGTGALTAINLSSGSTFTSDQPKEFTIDLSANTSSGKTLIKNGTINFTRVKNTNVASQYQVALGKVDATYSSNGTLSNSIVTSLNKDVPTTIYDYIKTNPSALSFVAAGEDVTLNSLHLDKNNQLTGIATSTGDSKTPIYITVLINNSATGVPEAGMYRLYTDTDGNITTTKVTYTGTPKNPDGSPKPNGGEFSIDLSSLASQLTDDAKITVVASKDFVESPTITETVAALRQVNTTTLQELVDAAPEEEQKPSYYNASEEAQKAYTDAIAAGQEILDSPASYDQSDVDRAVSVIQLALTALTGKETDKTALQTAVDQASSVESSDNYTNADTSLQDDYQAAIKAGQGILSKENATQTEVNNALTAINTAKDALNGDAKKAASKEALQKAVDEAPTVKSDDAAYYNGSAEAKAAYDKAISAGQTVLDDPDATATQITDALNAINTAKGNLKGEATDKSALQKAVDNSATVKESNNYTNADETQKTAYDNAVTAAQTVLDKTNATQAEVNKALQNLETANNNLNGDAKTEAANKAALEAAVKDAPNVRNTPAYYNGSEEARTAYNNAITAGQAVLDQANPSATEVKNALDAINAAKDNLKGEATNTEALQTALSDAKKAKETGNYTNADQAKQEALNNAITAGQTVLNNTNATQTEVDNASKAITDAISGLNGNANLEDAKDAATEAIQKALDSKTTQITDATNIDQATKEQLIADAKKAAENANTAINQATDPNAVNTAKAEGITNINKVTVPSLDGAKEAANKAIDQALDTKTKEINNAENIDQTTKDQLIKEATDAANTAKDAIEKSTTNDEATKAGQAGVDAINNVKVPSVTDSQNAAKDAIDDALNAKTKEINDANNIDQTTKDQLIKEATDAANNAKEAIDKATAADAIKTARDEGTTNINNVTVPSLEDAKKAANKAVDDALTAQTEVINKADNLSDTEKKDLIDQATAEATTAKAAIEKATTNNEAAQAGQAGVDAIKKIVPTSLDTVKSDANKAIEAALTKKLEEINSANALTTDEKTALTQEANTAADKAKEEITNATTNDAVIEAQNNGVTAIDGIKVPTESAVKEAAKKAVADAATVKNNAIDASNLTNEEKTALKQKVTDAQNAADQAIDNATTNAAVTEAQTNGVNAINAIEVTTSTAKEAAKKAVADAATAKNNAIDASNLTDEEKAALKQKVTEAQNAADQAIDNATSNTAVTEAKDNGVSAIEDIEVPTTSANKEKATTDLNTAVENAKKAIDQDSNLTDEQKQAAKDQIDSDAKTAQEAINDAKTDNDVKKAADNGTLAIDKDVANAAIDNAVAGKLKEIQDPLTTEEKQAYTDLINSEANNAKQNIANATTVEEVTTAQTNGVNEITNTEIPTTSSAKDKAIAAINDALQKKTDEINNASNINTQEKTDLINQATEAANTAKNNINNATTNAAVDTAQTNGEKAIADVTVPNLSDVKKESIDLVNKALDAKTAEINNASNLSQDEKQSLINDATNAATEAINNINESQTNDDAKAAATTGVQNIENVTIPTLDDAKKNANQAIDDALKSKVNEINNASNLNDTEKQKLVDQANEAATTAKNNVENATTNDAARDAANAGIDNIKGISFTSLEDAKKAANTAIDNALQVKTDEINNASNLSTDEKQDLINQASEAAKNAKDNINNATTNDAVTEAQNKGIADIANVTVPSLDQVKQDAINAIKQVQDAKNKQIAAASNLSAEEQKALTDQVDKIANDAIAKINDAATTTNDAVTATRDDAIKQITDLFIPTLDGAQTDAINAIESAKNAKLNDINNAAHLTDQEKQALVDQTNKAADEATKAIKSAQTNDEVKSAETAGLDNINNITIPTLVQKQQEAIEELNAARDAKNSAIDNAADLTTDEKNALKDKVQAEYSNAVSNITSATTDEAVTTAKENGIAAIKDIQIPTKSAAKEQATTDLNTAVDDAKKAIDQDSNLTDEEKQAAKDQIDSDAKKAQEAIDNAKTDDEVNSAVDNGKLAIDKDIANAAIDNAVAGKKDEIAKSPLTDEEKTALNNEVDQKAQDAKEAVNNATTPEAVTTAQDNGVKNINDTEVPTESTAKEAAKKAIAEAAEAKNNAIDSSNLTDEEKTALKQEVTDAQNAANTAIDNATTNAAVTEAEDNGVKAINGIEVPTKSPAKEQATTDLNDAVDDAKKAIDQDNNLTDEEKQAAKDQIDSDAKKAQEAIDNAKTDDEVKTAVDNGQLAIDKDVANAAIDNAVAGKKAEIAKAPLTTDEAKALNDLVDQEAKAAKKAIDSATTIPAVDDAKNTGVAAINDIAVPTTSSTKDQANQTIDDALANKIKEINDATNLSDKQKQDLIDQANKEAAKAKENIKNATSNEAVNKATTDGVDAIANVTVPSLDDAKKDASQLIDDVLKQKEDEINNASHLTDQEKQDLIDQAQNAADEAKDKINQATTNDDVATERDAGAEKIANIVVPSLEDAKDKATKAIDDALADKTKEINDQTHLSDQEKNDLIKQITDIADKAKDKINNDSNDAEVAKDEKDGIDAIVDTKVPGLEDHKQNAIKSLDEAKSTKLAQIDEATHLTADEKANLTQQVDAEYNKALDNINKATTNDDADKASADGVEAILNIAVPSLNEKKQDSIDALNEVREAKKEEINNANNLSQDEKDELTKQVDQIADNAINAINGAKDDQTAKDAENKGIQDILDVKVPSLDDVKTNAKQAVADALESKTNEINAASNLDSATKQDLINRANVEADRAIEKIDQATSNDQALAASQAGVDKILGIEVPTLADAKQSAIDAINDALKQKETEINNASQLTSDEKQNLINQVNSIADNAKNAINNATTNQSVEEAKNAGIEKINAINVPTTSATKDEAIKAIDDALTNKVNEINNATNITADEKANLIDEANNAANTAKDNITKATSDSGVATATTDGINAIANVTVPSLETAKDQAKNLIDDVLNEKKNEINNAQNLSDNQKQDLINQATDEADQAKKNIDNATTNNDVQTAEDNGAQAIENVTVPSLDEAKKASTKVIDEVLKEKTAEINAATNLSNTEKDALIKDATTAANTAKDNIAKATTNDAVKDAETDGVKAILDIKVPGREDQQKDAIAALDRALADKVSEIDNANNLSETTKQDLKQQAQAAYTTAVDNVNNAQTSAEINAARDNGVQAILDITVPTLTDAQDASITAVEQVRDAKKTQIEAAKNLTETQKEALKNQVDEIADKAIDNIKNATTDATVKDAETAGINEILNVTIPTLDAAKSDAKQAIADALTAKTAEINAAQNLTDAEKQKLIDQAQTEAAAANKNIDAATTNDAAELAAKNGVQAILDIQVPTVEETRDQAKKNVDNALNSKKEEINNSNLSSAAKEALINEAEQAAENARTAIDNATTASAISEAEAAGIAAIENIKVSNAPTESDNPSNNQTNTETPTEGNSTSQNNNNATQAPVQGNNTQADLTGSHGTNLTTGQQTEKAADTNSKETLPQTGNETERGLSIAGLAIASLLGLFGLSGLGKKRD